MTIGNVYNTNVIDGKLSISINGEFKKDRAGALKRNLSNFFTSWNTLITRSQVGSVLIDNSKDKILSSLFSIKSESNQAFVPSKEPEIKKMRENKISLFNAIKDEPYSYTRPTVKEAKKAEPTTKPTSDDTNKTTDSTDDSISKPASDSTTDDNASSATNSTVSDDTTKQTTEPPVADVSDDTSKSTDTASDADKKNTTLSAFEGTASFSSDLLTSILDENVENPITSDISENFSSDNETKKVSSRLASPDEDLDSGNVNDDESIKVAKAVGKTTFHMTRVYTDVVRAGCEITEEVSPDGKITYSAKNSENDEVISDLWLLMNADETINEQRYNDNIEKLKRLQFYLTYKHIYGKNVELPEDLIMYEDLYENGKIVIKIDPKFNDKNNYDKNPGNEWKNNENGKNALKDIPEFEGKGAYVTLQCIYKTDNGIVKAVTLGEFTALKT